MSYSYSAYGANPNSGRNANAENGWGPYKWPAGVPTNLLASAKYGNVTLVVRYELAPLVQNLMLATERVHGYNLFGPVEKPPAGWCWGYSNRAIAGTSTASNHSKGRAADLNAPNNPYTSPLVCDLPPAMVKMWECAGFYWGGRYSGSKDAMHFEYCWTPGDVARHNQYVQQIIGGAVPPPPGQEDYLDMVTKEQWDALVGDVQIIKANALTTNSVVDGLNTTVRDPVYGTAVRINDIQGTVHSIDEQLE